MIQVCPLYRVVLAFGFCSGDLRLKPLCGWHPHSRNFHHAIFESRPNRIRPSGQSAGSRSLSKMS